MRYPPKDLPMLVLSGQVAEALNNAVEDGYAEILHWPDADIANDLVAYCDWFEHMTPSSLIPAIQSWRASREVPR
jgi:hypothetical protein